MTTRKRPYFSDRMDSGTGKLAAKCEVNETGSI